MNQKYIITRNDKNTELTIAEHAEVDKDTFELLCEETFPIAEIQSAAKEGPDAVVSTFRSKHLYPPHESSQRIAETVIYFVTDDEMKTVEVGFDDKTAMREAIEAEAELALADVDDADDSVMIDELLKDTPAILAAGSVSSTETSGTQEDN